MGAAMQLILEGGCSAARQSLPNSKLCYLPDAYGASAQVTQLFSQYVLGELEEYAKAPSKAWQAKDCAIYLVVAVTVQVWHVYVVCCMPAVQSPMQPGLSTAARCTQCLSWVLGPHNP